MPDEEEADSDMTGTLNYAGHLAGIVSDLKSLHFPDGTDDAEIHLFAISIGIRFDRRLPATEWKTGPDKNKSNPGSHIRNLAHIDGLKLLLEAKGDLSDGQKLNKVLSEYLNGGLTWIENNEVHKRSFGNIDRVIPGFASLEEE